VLGGGSSRWANAETRFFARKYWSLRWKGSCRSASAPTDPRKKRRARFANWELPYVADPAVTRHLAAFLASAGEVAPDAILSMADSSFPKFFASASRMSWSTGTEGGL